VCYPPRLMRRVRVLAVVIIVVGATGARADECVREWTAASLARGPAAIANAPLLPIRSAVGGFQLGRENKSPGMQAKILLPPTLAFAGGGMGLLESVIWVGTGLADTATGGYFQIAPDEATELSVAPVRPAFAPDSQRPKTERCSR
jgi:hypothetical protein